MKRKTTVLALLFYLFTITVNAQTSSQPAKFEFSVQQCIDYGVKNNVQVKNALLDYNIQEQTNKTITAAAYPQISASAGTTYFRMLQCKHSRLFLSCSVWRSCIGRSKKW
jgi:cytochrome c oxidase assembly protein Cox11